MMKAKKSDFTMPHHTNHSTNICCKAYTDYHIDHHNVINYSCNVKEQHHHNVIDYSCNVKEQHRHNVINYSYNHYFTNNSN